jgi:hypothetical protein
MESPAVLLGSFLSSLEVVVSPHPDVISHFTPEKWSLMARYLQP